MTTYYVYMLTNATHRLYVGVTRDLQRRIYEHKRKLVPGFTNKYNLSWLACYETTSDVKAAIAREKQIKGWSRSKKTALVESANPNWVDLSAAWFDA
ncbi:MAG: GIY-YIG nuclease family protein, partial [Chloroflexi bacterium]|nr:GIY-YIG nuclease family protein [Chloroflexota bacterium]